MSAIIEFLQKMNSKSSTTQQELKTTSVMPDTKSVYTSEDAVASNSTTRTTTMSKN